MVLDAYLQRIPETIAIFKLSAAYSEVNATDRPRMPNLYSQGVTSDGDAAR